MAYVKEAYRTHFRMMQTGSLGVIWAKIDPGQCGKGADRRIQKRAGVKRTRSTL